MPIDLTDADSQCLGCGFSGLLFDGDQCPSCQREFSESEFEAARKSVPAPPPAVPFGITPCPHCGTSFVFKPEGTCPACQLHYLGTPVKQPDLEAFDQRVTPRQHALNGLGELGAIALKGFFGLAIGFALSLFIGLQSPGLVVFCFLGGLAFALENFRNLKVARHAIASSRTQRMFGKGKIAKRYVLFLRGFDSDEDPEFRHGHFLCGVVESSCEEILRQQLPSGYEMVAIGAPGKGVRLGSRRMYFDNDHWQDAVKRLIEEADYVIFRPGHGTFLGWELEHIQQLKNPLRVAITLDGVPPAVAEMFIQEHFPRLSIDATLSEYIDMPDGEIHWDKPLLFFDSNWKERPTKKTLAAEISAVREFPSGPVTSFEGDAEIPLPNASRKWRIASTVIDIVLTSLPCRLVDLLTGSGTEQGWVFNHPALSFILSYYLLNGWLLFHRGQSLGKLILKLQLVNREGSPVRRWKALVLRPSLPFALLALSPSWLPLILIDFIPLVGRSARYLHDYLAETRLTRAT